MTVTPEELPGWIKSYGGYLSAEWCEDNFSIVDAAIKKSLIKLRDKNRTNDLGYRCWSFEVCEQPPRKTKTPVAIPSPPPCDPTEAW